MKSKLYTIILGLLILGCLFFSGLSFAQERDSNIWDRAATLDKQRLKTVVYTETGLYTLSMVGLYALWYADYDQTSFHFFNDANEWQGVDKIGHATSAYHVSKTSIDLLRWAGMNEKKSRLFGGFTGVFILSSVEVMDGFSSEWGFSNMDFISNLGGSVLLVGQDAIWKEQRITLKFSAQHTNYAQYRPDLLGEGDIERLMKDYNGQTYWASFNIESFLKEENNFPKWLDMSFGYGAEGMVSAEPETYMCDDAIGLCAAPFDRRKQFYFSLDADLWRIKNLKPGFLKTFLNTISFIKIPAPTLEFIDGKLKMHALYF